jgi:hypothetical protein
MYRIGFTGVRTSSKTAGRCFQASMVLQHFTAHHAADVSTLVSLKPTKFAMPSINDALVHQGSLIFAAPQRRCQSTQSSSRRKGQPQVKSEQWKDPQFRTAFMKKIAALKGFEFSDLDQWYDITLEYIISNGGNGLAELADFKLDNVRFFPTQLPDLFHLVLFP